MVIRCVQPCPDSAQLHEFSPMSIDGNLVEITAPERPKVLTGRHRYFDSSSYFSQQISKENSICGWRRLWAKRRVRRIDRVVRFDEVGERFVTLFTFGQPICYTHRLLTVITIFHKSTPPLFH